LDLTRRDVSDGLLASLVIPAVALSSASLRTLILTRNDICDAGAAAIAAALPKNTSLTRIDLNQNNIGDAGAIALCRALSGQASGRLRRLDLAWNGDIALTTALAIASTLVRNVTTAVVTERQLGNAPQGAGGELFLSGQVLGDEGVAAVAALLRGNTAVTSLCLADCGVQAAGCEALIALLNADDGANFTLTAVDLNENYDLENEVREELSTLLVRNRRLPELFLGRYQPDAAPPVHRSATSVVLAATDSKAAARVALKCMRRADHLQRELAARRALVTAAPTASAAANATATAAAAAAAATTAPVVEVLGFHVPADSVPDFVAPLSGSSGLPAHLRRPRDELAACDSGDGSLSFPYVLVLQLGGRSLHEACARERLAAHDPVGVACAFRDIALCLDAIHRRGWLHGDVKQRNVVRVAGSSLPPAHAASADWRAFLRDGGRGPSQQQECWRLCDLEGSVPLGARVGTRCSTAYGPPELARAMACGAASSLDAHCSFDVWSLGVVLLELCQGRPLFGQDTSDDSITSYSDRVRLCAWHTASDAELASVFPGSTTPTVSAAARHLLRWMLKGDPSARPSMQQVLAHPFIALGTGMVEAQPAQLEPPLPMKYRFFLSHVQAEASGAAKVLFLGLRALGVSTWLDVDAQNLTLDGMRAGVRDSDALLVILTRSYFGSWYCQQELQAAVERGLPIQLLLEQDKRFFPFDISVWQTAGVGGGVRTWKKANSSDEIAVPTALAAAIDASLATAVVFRRRDFEFDAMLRELCARRGVPLPPRDDASAPSGVAQVAVVHWPASGGRILSELAAAFARLAAEDGRLQVQLSADVEGSDAILVLLTPGVISRLEAALRLQLDAHRIVFLYSSEWVFDCAEHKAASAAVQSALAQHEALPWRPWSINAEYEHAALMRELASRLLNHRCV
jgi:serine/threonine protein kinase